MDPIKSLGTILEGEHQRDAIHIAVQPVVAAERLKPGTHVAVITDHDDGLVHVHRTGEKIGVIDPFLKEPVEKGQRCHMFLYPGTITGLRHEWTHPALLSHVDAHQVRKVTNALLGDSEMWLRNFAIKYSLDYHELLRAATEESDDIKNFGRYVTANGRDLHGASELGEDHDLFWQHLENYTGKKFDATHRDSMGWSCSC